MCMIGKKLTSSPNDAVLVFSFSFLKYTKKRLKKTFLLEKGNFLPVVLRPSKQHMSVMS